MHYYSRHKIDTPPVGVGAAFIKLKTPRPPEFQACGGHFPKGPKAGASVAPQEKENEGGGGRFSVSAVCTRGSGAGRAVKIPASARNGLAARNRRHAFRGRAERDDRLDLSAPGRVTPREPRRAGGTEAAGADFRTRIFPGRRWPVLRTSYAAECG